METKYLPIQTVRRHRLSDEITQQLENLILNNELNIGDALPPERELAAQLGVSRNILREAINTMMQKGLLEVRQGLGTFIVSPTVDVLRDSLSFFVRFNVSGLFDLLEARLALEVQIAELAASRSTDEDHQQINLRLQEMEAVVGDPDQYIEADIRFHAALAKAAKNEILYLLLESIRGAMRENIRAVIERHTNAVQRAMPYHRQIAQAIQQGSPVAARDSMRAHLESLRHDLQNYDPL
jgi:GntR family transcriptional repressor for pyruvate dehydrogenase complex